MSTKRVSSKMKQKEAETKMLEEQTKKMQQKLNALKQHVQEQKKLKQTNASQSTITKWKKITGETTSLKSYAKKVLADRKQALNKYGIDEKKIIGAKSFEPALTKIRSENAQKDEKDLSKIPKFQFKGLLSTKKQQVEQLPTQSIQNNFFKAKINTKQFIRRKTLQQFLQQNFLQQYLRIFQQNDINDIQDLYRLSKENLLALNIPSGHVVKIMKRVKQEIDGKGETKNTDITEKLQKNSQKVSFGYGDGDINSYQQLNKKQEQIKIEQHRLNENHENNKIDISDEQNEDQSNYDQQQEDQVIITRIQMAEFSLQTNNEQGNSAINRDYDFNCFQCYKRSTAQPFESSDGRLFCSQACLNKYLQFMQKKCPECDDTFYKFNGYFEDGLWFCSIKCSPNQQKIAQMFIQWSAKPSLD